jgi:tyrosine-protein kinase Etk/Wzc
MKTDHLPYTPFEEYADEGTSFDLKEKLGKLLFHWPLFIICIAFCLSMAYLHLRSAVPVYTVKAPIPRRPWLRKSSSRARK